jgi:hypothetical protein
MDDAQPRNCGATAEHDDERTPLADWQGVGSEPDSEAVCRRTVRANEEVFDEVWE